MSVFRCEGILDFLSEEQKNQLSVRFASSSVRIMPHEISGPLGLKYSDALVVLTALQAVELCQNFLLIYHKCDFDVPWASTPFEQGAPDMPWQCPNCQEIVENIEDLSFGIMALTKEPINFV